MNLLKIIMAFFGLVPNVDTALSTLTKVVSKVEDAAEAHASAAASASLASMKAQAEAALHTEAFKKANAAATAIKGLIGN